MIEHIIFLEEKIATIVRGTHTVENLEFFTDDTNPLQVGMHSKKAGTNLTPHIHLSKTKVITEIQEVLYLIKGKVKVTFYTIEGDIIDEKTLNTGDIAILMKLGHGFEVIEDSLILEVKQGPYPGTQHAKIYLKK
ncbi:MAG: hypothetical protein ABI425_02850 [Patescibacteria group bacterium]